MSSLKNKIDPLESDLKAVPPRINVYHDLPFAIMRYDSTDEWEMRREIKLLATRLEAVGKDVCIISMSELLWAALEKVHQKDDDEGLDAVIALETTRGYIEAQQQVPFDSRWRVSCAGYSRTTSSWRFSQLLVLSPRSPKSEWRHYCQRLTNPPK